MFCSEQRGVSECDAKGLPLTLPTTDILGGFQYLKGQFVSSWRKKNSHTPITKSHDHECTRSCRCFLLGSPHHHHPREHSPTHVVWKLSASLRPSPWASLVPCLESWECGTCPLRNWDCSVFIRYEGEGGIHHIIKVQACEQPESEGAVLQTSPRAQYYWPRQIAGMAMCHHFACMAKCWQIGPWQVSGWSRATVLAQLSKVPHCTVVLSRASFQLLGQNSEHYS